MTAIFSVAYGVLLRPLPYPDPDRLVDISVDLSGVNSSFAPLYDRVNQLSAAAGLRPVTSAGLGGVLPPERQLRSNQHVPP